VTTGLLLLHAWPMDARMWNEQVAAFSDRLPVVAPDLPGFGSAPAGGEVATMAAAAARAMDALDAVGVDRVVVCGLSMGGYVAFEVWRRWRERVAALVLSNTRAVADPPQALEARRALANRLRSEGIGFFLADLPPLLSVDPPPEVEARVREIVGDQTAEAIAAASLGLGERPDSTPDLPTIDVPTVVIASTGDRLIPPEVTLEMAQGIPGAVQVTLPEAGHLANLEDPGGFTGAVDLLLGRLGL
jgi:pimeloyl-ACP methyl ester carboxylesterase